MLLAGVRSRGANGYWRVKRDFLAGSRKPDRLLLAICQARLGENEQALTNLEQALQEHEPDLIYLKSEPAFDSLHDHPRFKALLEVMHLS